MSLNPISMITGGKSEHPSRHRVGIIVYVTIILFACSCTAAPKPTADPNPTATLKITLPATSLPAVAPTIILTNTPLPSPSPTLLTSPEALPTAATAVSESPAFAYLNRTSAETFVYRMSLGGEKVSEWKIEDNRSLLSTQGLSPDGRWLVYYKGSPILPGEETYGCLDFYDQSTGDPSLTLMLLDLETGESTLVSSLLPSDYPQNFERARAELPSSIKQTAEELRYTFFCGLPNHAWSPDGQYLAFASGQDGPSSDLYLFEAATKTTRRLTSGPEEIVWLKWSPDGEWILHHSAYTYNEAGNGYGLGHFYAARASGEQVVDLPSENIVVWHGWLTDSACLVADGDFEVGSFALRSIDISSGTEQEIWPGAFKKFVLDPEQNYLLIAGQTGRGTGDEGLFFVNLPDGTAKRLAEDTFWDMQYLGFGDLRFWVQGNAAAHSQAATASAELVPFIPASVDIALSPDGQILAALQPHQLGLYNNTGEEIEVWPLTESAVRGDSLFWRPDSTGLFFTLGDKLYILDAFTSQPRVVDTGIRAYNFKEGVVWVKQEG